MSNSVHCQLKRLIQASVVGNVLLLAALVILYIVHKTLQDQSPNITPTPSVDALTDNAGQVCLPCDFQGQQSGDTLYEFILKTDNNKTLCCLQRDDVLQDLILELEEENGKRLQTNSGKPIPKTLRWWTERNHAAHLYASDIRIGQNLSWKQRGIRTSFIRNLTLSDDGRQLAVNTMPGAGLYFVYALYTFDFTNAATNRQSPMGIHNIYKHRPAIINSEKERLWTAKFGGTNSAKRQTSFLCGIVNMNMLDTIESEAISYVAGEECTTRYIDRSPYSNYFGMFKLIDLS
ncbi:uncharacterized protein LOC117342352 [Pecten maximus]|uniref:uncharacterized protein LOC117342352 n=1 Tax=Pecten maximus TaxID=6579 RepID=UPI001458F36F|nr:uncharacterized protein LOC117342352 [Pecten maximus]